MLSHLIESWVALYANHAALRTSVEFIHIGGLVAGGGCAVTADLAALASEKTQAGATQRWTAPGWTHRLVVSGLIALSVSGVLLLAADLDTYLYSRIFWIKMALLAALLVNGLVVLSGERQLARGHANGGVRFRRASLASLTLWTLTTLAGAALPNIG